MVEVLIPALMYLSVLEGLRAALETRTSSTLAAVFFPPVWGLVVPIVGGVAALGTVRLVARDKPDAVQRVVMLCIAMGNSGNMPLLILTALCDNFEPFMKDAKCVSEAASLSMLYCITWNILLVRSVHFRPRNAFFLPSLTSVHS